MRRMRVFAVTAIAFLGLAMSLAPASAANPGAAAAPLGRASTQTDIVKADWYCGPGRYLDSRGYCRRYGYYGYGYYGYGLPYYNRYHGGRNYNYHGGKNYKHYGGKSYKHHGNLYGRSFNYRGGGGGGKSFKHSGGGGGKGHGGGGKQGGGHGGKGGKRG